jgi:hypothetical protein
MASNKREMYAERKGRCEGGEKVGGGYFFVNNQEKTRGMEGGGGGEVVEGTQK